MSIHAQTKLTSQGQVSVPAASVWVASSDEELMIAQHVWRLLDG